MSESYEYAVRWGESIPGFPDVSRTVTTAEEAQAIIDGSAYPGVIVRRVVADWSEPSDSEPCDHGSYWTDHDGRDHCLVCPHVSQPSEPHVHEFKLRYVCDCGEHSRGHAKGPGHE